MRKITMMIQDMYIVKEGQSEKCLPTEVEHIPWRALNIWVRSWWDFCLLN